MQCISPSDCAQDKLIDTLIVPQRLVFQAAAIYRTRRFSDEGNSAQLPAGWDAACKANWQSADKHWLIESYAMNLLNKDAAATVGVNAVWKY